MSPGIITKPDSEVLDLQRLLLPDLLDGDDLTGGLLELPQLPQEVPEPAKKLVKIKTVRSKI